VALNAGTIVDFVRKFLPVTMSGLAIIILVGRFWPRATWQGALSALIVTPLLSLTAMFFFKDAPWNNAVLLAIPGFIIHFIVSLLTPPPVRGFAEVAEALRQERQNIEGKSFSLASESPH
jgi:SSS family solute:Na+ symporter